MKTIGILGGMGPLATADLFRKIILNTKAEKDQGHIPVIIDSNTKIADRTAYIVGKGENPLPEMIRSARRLEGAGADFIIMPCNTAHYFFKELSQSVGIPFLNMVEETVNYIRQTFGDNTSAGLLATDGTLKSGIFDNYFKKTSMKLLKPEKTQHYVMELIYEGVKKGNYAIGTEGFLKAMEELQEKGAELFILGCTELSSAKELFKLEGKFVDPMDVLARRAIEFAGASTKIL